MSAKQVLSTADYAIILIFLLLSALVGIGAKLTGGKQKTTKEYFLADKKAPIILIISSTTATLLSAISMLGSPAEVYRYGIHVAVLAFGIFVGIFLASIIFTPAYFELKVDSIYEILYSATVLYAPVLALNAVTNIPLEMGIIFVDLYARSIVWCAIYFAKGGLKAVLWTDLFQTVLMFLCLFIVFVVGIAEVGGIGKVFRIAAAGNRLQYFDMQFDFTSRATFWNMWSRGFILGIYHYGANQVEVQRSLCMSDCKKAQRTLRWSSITIAIVYNMTCYAGIVLYAVFYLCDPIKFSEHTGLTKYDQLLPYFIITRLKSFPGLTGLCIAGIFSGSLSSISSAINSMSTVSVIDFVMPSFPSQLSQRMLVLIAKVLSLVYGIAIIGITFTISNIDSIFQAGTAFMSLAEGPVLTVFLIGVLTRKVSDKVDSFIQEKRDKILIREHARKFLGDYSRWDTFVLYKIAAGWIPGIGTFIGLVVLLTTSLLIDRNRNIITSDSKCLSPVAYWWMSKSSQIKQSKSNTICTMNQEDEL
ncbi:sodium-dependent multivitamin transporter-like [Argiope bruennichi]|uniref:sodium-dependent multivitamin transporter-like n=1 Tax=Argiope bruennichi TaxID=94029 RepID=UPI0024959075|nr:sodium-dependent multivitamin transporter-like [Argiope bruennichi]